MKQISTGIYAKCTSGTSLHTAIGGRIYKGYAPQEATFPYIVFSLISDVPGNTWGSNIQETLWQFDIFSIATGSTEIEDIYTYLKSLYDNCTLTVTSATFIKMTRESSALMVEEMTTSAGETLVWHYSVDYTVIAVKTA